MTKTELRQIESRLGIELPERYRRLLIDHADRLKELGWSNKPLVPLYVSAKQIIRPNIEEREPESDTARFFANWWKKFVMIGTNGGGDFYCLRLSNADGVWLIGSDCGNKPMRFASTLNGFVEEMIANRSAEKSRQRQERRERAAFQPEIDAHLAAMKRDGSPNLERGWWLSSDAIYPMFNELDQLKPKVSPRKLRLFGLAMCRLIGDLEHDKYYAAAITLARRMTLDQASPGEITAMRTFMRRIDGWRAKAVYNLYEDDRAYLAGAGHRPGDPDLTQVYAAVGYVLAGYPYGAKEAPTLLREVLGNPFHPASVLEPWRTPEVARLAQSVFDTEQFDGMPGLGKALTVAGCKDKRILAHCSRSNGHVRGCWVVDEILDRV